MTTCAFTLHITAKPGKRTALMMEVQELFDALREEVAFGHAFVCALEENPDGLFAFELRREAKETFLHRLKTHSTVRTFEKRMQPLLADRKITFVDAPPFWASVDLT